MIKRVLKRLARSCGLVHGRTSPAPDPATPTPVVASTAASPQASTPPEVAKALRVLSQKIPAFADALQYDRQAFDYWPCMTPDTYQGKDVLDLGCGIGGASAIFLERGARFVWGIDPVLTDDLVQTLRVLPRARFTSGVLSAELIGKQRFDLVYAQFVTEHIHDLPCDLALIYSLLKPGGRFVGLHDSYYGPMGGHDHAFIGPVPGNWKHLQVKAPPCWESPQKCEDSKEFRAEVEKRHDWTVKHWNLTPDDCSKCLYFRRAHVWGHLLHQESYNQDYPGEFYKCSVHEGGLNKATPFQLKQYLIEAGFKVTTWAPQLVENTPPAELLATFSQSDLQTGAILFAGDKPAVVQTEAAGDNSPQGHRLIFNKSLKNARKAS